MLPRVPQLCYGLRLRYRRESPAILHHTHHGAIVIRGRLAKDEVDFLTRALPNNEHIVLFAVAEIVAMRPYQETPMAKFSEFQMLRFRIQPHSNNREDIFPSPCSPRRVRGDVHINILQCVNTMGKWGNVYVTADFKL
jgi:hypothetical protein